MTQLFGVQWLLYVPLGLMLQNAVFSDKHYLCILLISQNQLIFPQTALTVGL
jgi:hypothetical protein